MPIFFLRHWTLLINHFVSFPMTHGVGKKTGNIFSVDHKSFSSFICVRLHASSFISLWCNRSHWVCACIKIWIKIVCIFNISKYAHLYNPIKMAMVMFAYINICRFDCGDTAHVERSPTYHGSLFSNSQMCNRVHVKLNINYDREREYDTIR